MERTSYLCRVRIIAPLFVFGSRFVDRRWFIIGSKYAKVLPDPSISLTERHSASLKSLNALVIPHLPLLDKILVEPVHFSLNYWRDKNSSLMKMKSEIMF
jgi:hypothetical protein